jgi:hypothetical protein
MNHPIIQRCFKSNLPIERAEANRGELTLKSAIPFGRMATRTRATGNDPVGAKRSSPEASGRRAGASSTERWLVNPEKPPRNNVPHTRRLPIT